MSGTQVLFRLDDSEEDNCEDFIDSDYEDGELPQQAPVEPKKTYVTRFLDKQDWIIDCK